ncbi:hypothetical protein HDU78_002091 [Chytriomyces hyalinus]|nr:hypothetical protein HDU78_002091 [Chytriomyces hyalinus]
MKAVKVLFFFLSVARVAVAQDTALLDLCIFRNTPGETDKNLIQRYNKKEKKDGTNLHLNETSDWKVAEGLPYGVFNIPDYNTEKGDIELELSCVASKINVVSQSNAPDDDLAPNRAFNIVPTPTPAIILSRTIPFMDKYYKDIDAGVMLITAVGETSLDIATAVDYSPSPDIPTAVGDSRAENAAMEGLEQNVTLITAILGNDPAFPKLNQKTYYTFLDAKDKYIISDEYGYGYEWGILESVLDNVPVPPKARSVLIEVETNSPFYCIGRYDVYLRQYKIKNVETYEKLANGTFVLALLLGVLSPLVFFIQAKLVRQPANLAILDLIQAQGSRFIRAILCSLPVTFLFLMLGWFQSSKKNQEDRRGSIPLFGGFNSQFLIKTEVMKAAATPIFMLFFLLIGLIFYPVFLSYAHVNQGSRFAAVIGFVTIINATILRVTLYVLMNPPNTPMYRRVLSNLLEILSYAISIIYFGSSILAPEEYENKIRKTNFRNAIHVQSLLRKYHIQFVPEEPVPTRFDKIKAFFLPKDRRPIWLRGRPQDDIITRIKVFFRISKVPARLIAIFAMIILFTYQQVVYIVLKVLDNSPTISCVFGLASSEIISIFKDASRVIQILNPVQLFGVSMSDALEGFDALSDAVNLFRRIIQGSALCAVLLTLVVLTFNLIDLSVVVMSDLAKLRVGNYEGFVTTDVNSANAAQASKYMGLQIGFAVIGTALRKFVWDLVLQNGSILIAIVLTTILGFVQSFIINRFFVAYFITEEENKMKEEKRPDRQSTQFWLKSLNRFNHIDMFFMFPNLISGIFGFIGSIFVALLTSAVFAYRLDKPALFSFFSKRGCYSSWILLEHHHTNPVVLVAIKLFWDVVIPEHHSSMARFIQSDQKPPTAMYFSVAAKEPRSRHARLRWYLAYTLIHNPELRAYRKQRVQETYLNGYVAKYEVPRLKLETMKKEAAALEKRRVDMRVAETECWRAHRLREGGEARGFGGDRV